MISNLGVMLDCSRNSVMTVESVKKFILYLEKMDYKILQLYTEDTYEIPEEPLFGHFRGRYSQEEIKEIDAFAKEHGIELQPCIQTLAHLNQLFFWDKFAEIKDCGDILLAENEKTYALIDNMFKSISNSYTTKTVNIGMDEAHLLGAGKYFHQNGYKKRFDILIEHLKKVSEIAKKYNFQLLMWSDMFFRLVNKGEYYPEDGEKCPEVPKEIRDKLPENVTLVYWNYYYNEENIYDDMIDRHLDFGKPLWFAGGIWKWLGFHTGNICSYPKIASSIKSCNKKGVNNVLFTLWGDDGNESPVFAVLPALLYASQCAKGNYNLDDIENKFFEIFNENYQDFLLFDMCRPDFAQRSYGGRSAGAKEFLYCDTFLGKFDSTVIGDEGEFFAEMELKLKKAKTRSKNFAYIFESYEKLCRLMKIKYTLGYRTRNAYKNGDKEELQLIIKDFSKAIRYTQDFINYFRKMWFTDSKPHGFDVQDLRLGGVIQRLKANQQRLIDYVNGKVVKIDELEEALVNVLVGEKQKCIPSCNNFLKIATPNSLSLILQ